MVIKAPNLLLPPGVEPTPDEKKKDREMDSKHDPRFSQRFGIVTYNCGRDAPTSAALNSFRNIERGAPMAVVGFQEIDEADAPNEHALIRQVFGDTHKFAGFSRKVPIAIPSTWEIINAGADRITRSGSQIGQPNQSPARYVTFARIQHPSHKLASFVVVNSHAPRNHPPLKPIRDEWLEGMRETVKRFTDKGLTVFVTCDPNGIDAPLHKNERRLVNKNIDRISYIPGSVVLRDHNIREIKTYVEARHQAYVVNGELRNA